MIVVTGGNGQLGRHIVAAVKDLIGPDFVVTVRDTAKAADLAAQGITVKPGDFDKPDEIAHAFEGAETLLIMATSRRRTCASASTRTRRTRRSGPG